MNVTHKQWHKQWLESKLTAENIYDAKETCEGKIPLQTLEDEIFNGEITVDADAAIQANKSCYIGELRRKYNFSQYGESIRRIGPHLSADSEDVKRMVELLIKYELRGLRGL